MIRIFSLVAIALIFCVSCEDPGSPWDFYCPPYDPMIIDTHVIWSVDKHPELITRDILVKPCGKLEIREGTHIPFLPGSEIVCDPAGNMKRSPRLIVEGSLAIRGTESGKVLFVPSDGSDTVFGGLELSGMAPGGSECFIEWSSLAWVEASGVSLTIRFCDIWRLYIDDAEDIEIAGNTVDVISAMRCNGVLAENTVSERIYLRDDSLVVLRNQISGYGVGDLAGITSSGSSKAYIAENCLLNCGIGVKIFSGSPTIRFNDFVDCETNISVIPFMDRSEADTIYAQNNWWGSADESEILSKIVYIPNGETESGKVILIDPFETGPFMNCR